MPLLDVNNLSVAFATRNGVTRAVNGVSFSVGKGEILGIVGESGSGKSVTCMSLMGLIQRPPGRIDGGTAVFDGIDLLSADEKALVSLRGRRISMIFQDPMTSLNPYLKIGDQIIEPLLIHSDISRAEARKRGVAALEEVGIIDAASRFDRYPHEFSGGMRQRVMIAMALINNPDLLIADEPTTALDVTIQAQVLDLIRRLQRDRGMSVIFITHDLGVVANLCDRVQVMYAGRIVETADTASLFRSPLHPYTRALQRSIPALQVGADELYTIPGMPPDMSKPISGCAFTPRCQFAADSCRQTVPELTQATPGHAHACPRVARGEIQP